MVIKDGRFGPYVTDGETNASLRRGDSIEELTDERAAELLADRRARGPAKKAARKAAKKAPAKKAAAKKAPAKKAAAKKAREEGPRRREEVGASVCIRTRGYLRLIATATAANR